MIDKSLDVKIIEELKKNKGVAFVPSGKSMRPFIKDRKCSVIIEPITCPLKLYDVILYKRENGKIVLHRIIDIQKDFYVVCGDCQISTEKVLFSQIYGVMKGFFNGKNYVKSDDKKYLKKVEKWYKHKIARRIKIKIYHFFEKVNNHFQKNKRG